MTYDNFRDIIAIHREAWNNRLDALAQMQIDPIGAPLYRERVAALDTVISDPAARDEYERACDIVDAETGVWHCAYVDRDGVTLATWRMMPPVGEDWLLTLPPWPSDARLVRLDPVSRARVASFDHILGGWSAV